MRGGPRTHSDSDVTKIDDGMMERLDDLVDGIKFFFCPDNTVVYPRNGQTIDMGVIMISL